jgi:hypothetical protein
VLDSRRLKVDQLHMHGLDSHRDRWYADCTVLQASCCACCASSIHAYYGPQLLLVGAPLTPILPRVFASMLLSESSCKLTLGCSVMGACLLTVCALDLGARKAAPLLEPHVCISYEPAWQLGQAVAVFVACVCTLPCLMR